MDYFNILAIQPVKEVLLAKNKTSNAGIAIIINLPDTEKYAADLISYSEPHCFCFSVTNQDTFEWKPLIENSISFFFNTNYLKINTAPLLLISLPEKNIALENRITEQFAEAAHKQGFNQLALQFIYRNTNSNLTSESPIAYYILSKEQAGLNNETLKKIIELLLSGGLIGRFLFIESSVQPEIIDSINAAIENALNNNPQAKQLLGLYATLVNKYNNLQQKSTLLEQQLQNTQTFLTLTRDSFNHDLHWYKSEAHKIKEWSTAEVRRLKEWHYWQYEVLPPWFKKMGKRILRFSKPKKGFEE